MPPALSPVAHLCQAYGEQQQPAQGLLWPIASTESSSSETE